MKAEQPLKFPILVPGVGPVPAPGMIIGEAPGRNEIESGTPFCGRSGALLDSTLSDFGGDRRSYFVSNTFMGDVGDGNSDPTVEHIEDHRLVLQSEIAKVQPACILLLGRIACQSFGRWGISFNGPMRDYVGDKYWCEYNQYAPFLNNTVIIPSYHPAATMYNSTLIEPFRYAVARFVLLTDTLERARYGKDNRAEQHGSPGDEHGVEASRSS